MVRIPHLARIDREAVDAVVRLDFLADARNVVLVAPQGLGKTMIAQNIVHAALLAGHSALFVSASQLLLDLGAQESARALDRQLRYYTSRPLLCIDELGYLSYDTRNADLLFQVVSRRYERRSLVLTTNLAFNEWSTVFPNAACTTALIDRIVHQAQPSKARATADVRRRPKNRHARRKPRPDRRGPEFCGFSRPPTFWASTEVVAASRSAASATWPHPGAVDRTLTLQVRWLRRDRAGARARCAR